MRPPVILPAIPAILLVMIGLGCSKEAATGGKSPDGYEGFALLPSSKTNVKNSNDLPEDEQHNHLIWDSYYNGGGVAAGDINNDGLADLYFTNTTKENELYLNKGNFVFENVTAQAGVGAGPGVNWGVTMADINNDGWLDIYVCKSGPTEDPEPKRNKCYINNQNGTFSERAQAMGIDNAGYSVQAAFFDYDLDGDLDLFVMNQPSNARVQRMKYIDHEKEFITPNTSNRLFRNNGNMTFTDVSEAAGVADFIYGLGLRICDLNLDGWPDVYVASDYDWPDQALINNGDGTFTDKVRDYFTHISNFSMGMDIGDINNDGLDDLFVLDMAGVNHYRSKTNMPSMSAEKFWKIVNKGFHYQYMHNVLQLNRGHEVFSDISYYGGVSKTDWSWGALMMDADNDGFEDIYATNGIKRDIRNSDFLAKFKDMVDKQTVPAELTKIINMIPSTPMSNFMFHNDGQLHFSDKAKDWGLSQLSFSNGCAYADFDLDGDLDIVVNNVDAEAYVYENKAQTAGRHFLQFDLKSTKSHRPTEGTRVNLYAGGKLLQTEYYHPVRGFMSSSETVVHFGLGSTAAIDSAVFIWPDRNVSVMPQPTVDKRLLVDQDEMKKVRKFTPADTRGDWVTDHTASITPAFVHKENNYDDYIHQLLLPFRISTLGPGLAVADVNGDKLEDFFVGAATGQNGALYLQNKNGSFTPASSQPWLATTDILGALFLDVDGDQDQDLYLATGGSEYIKGDAGYGDMLFINDGKGGFTRSTGLPAKAVSTKAIAAGDWDKDGDLDLFIGSRNTPRKYPYADESYFLQNNGGTFTDVTAQVWPEDARLGMLTDAVFADKDQDGDVDLLYCGDWIAPTWLINDGGKFTKYNSPGLAEHSGWWNTVQLADINGDGILDILAGNAGTNNKFKASQKEPFIVLASDFDMNGNSDIVLATQFEGKEVPVRGRECSSQQLPYIAKEYPTYEGFAKASLQDIIGKERLKGSLRLEMTEFKNGIFWGKPDGDYTWEAFPAEAQLSPLVGFVVADANGDGKPEVIGAGNLYDTEVETTRYDAGQGVILSWSSGGWVCHPPLASGMYAGGNIRNLKPIHLGNQTGLLLARGNDKLSLFMLHEPVTQ